MSVPPTGTGGGGDGTTAASTPDPTKPPFLQSIYDQGYGTGTGYTYTPEDLQAIANWYQDMQMRLQFGQAKYEGDFLKLKGRELKLNVAQQKQMEDEFQWRTGEYWNWFKDEAFQYEKDKLGMEKQLSADQLAMSGNQLKMSRNQVAMSHDDLVRSANSTLASQYNLDATKAQSKAAIYQALKDLGVAGGGGGSSPIAAFNMNF